MEFLDSEEEWFVDDKYIYLWAPNGIDPSNSKVSEVNSFFKIVIVVTAIMSSWIGLLLY